jgi:threonylcarbamoyladenosine tRNA methylthiotransferase MtaB
MPTYRIVTLGCKLNQADSAALEARLAHLGLERARSAIDPEDGPGPAADLVILNTCTVTSNADREARQISRRLRRANPRALLIATGCYAERDRQALDRLPDVDDVVGMRDQASRIETLTAEAFGRTRTRPTRELGPFGATQGCDATADPTRRTRAYLKIQDGCDLRCSYCIIPAVRGDSRSLAADAVLQRLEDLSAAGYREIVFTGVNTGDYGRDLDPRVPLHDLLPRALRLPGLGRLRLNSLEPKTVSGEIVGLLAAHDGRLARHLQIPLQAGCDAVLARMRRPYRSADYARVTERLRRAIPDIALGADVIAGFPGETVTEFETTVRFIQSSPLNYLHVFSYSPRPGTAAATRTDRVPGPVVKERSARLRAIARRLSFRFRRSFVGRELPVLTLREIRPDGRLRALSDNYIDMGLDLNGRSAGPLLNRLLMARITRATEKDTLATLV